MNKRTMLAVLAMGWGALMSQVALAAGDAALTQGEVRRLDLAAGTVMLRHGPIKNLDMPAMTMVFKAGSAVNLKPFKVADQVQFSAVRQQGDLVLTRLQKAPTK